MRARGLLLVFALCVSVITAAERSDAGLNRWTTNGPFGGPVEAIAAHPTDPSVLLAGTGGGIFRSTNGGSSWNYSSVGIPPQSEAIEIEFAPSNPAIAFAGTHWSGSFKSTDGGRSWTPVSRASFATVAIDPTNPQIVYASGSETYKSVDGGSSWTELFWRGNQFSANELVIAPSAPNTIYAIGSGWLRSMDGGATWDGPVNGPSFFASAVVDPTNADVVVAASSDGIVGSTDGGFTWSRLDELGVSSIAIDPTNPSRMYAGTYEPTVFRSLDGGRSWSAYSSGLPDAESVLDRSGLPGYGSVLDLKVLADGSAVVAGIRYFGFFRRAAEAAVWSATNEGLVGTQVRALATPPSGGPTVYAGVPGMGLARSRDNGASWQWMGLEDRAIEGIAVHPTSASIIYAATHAGLYKSSNAGASWRLMHRVPFAGEVVEAHTAVAIAPSRPRVVYAATFEGGVFRSDDSGGTWRKLSLDQYSVVHSLAVHPQKPYTVYAGTNYLSVARSTDGGKTWRGRDDFIYGNERWQIAIDPTRPWIIYVAIQAGGVFRSTDSGRTWHRMAGGSPPRTASAVVVDPSHPNVIYAGGNGDYEGVAPGVFKSTDRGQTWTRLNGGLTTNWVDSLALSTSGRVLHAGTTAWWGVGSGGGVFSRTFG